jgi:hypothetical protein
MRIVSGWKPHDDPARIGILGLDYTKIDDRAGRDLWRWACLRLSGEGGCNDQAKQREE